MKRVLIIEDNVVLGRVWKRLLSKMGDTDVTVATTVASALWSLSESEYDLIICDFELPDGTGAAIHKWVVSRKPHMLDSFFFCTGVPAAAEATCGPGLQFIGKPMGPDDMATVASRLE